MQRVLQRLLLPAAVIWLMSFRAVRAAAGAAAAPGDQAPQEKFPEVEGRDGGGRREAGFAQRLFDESMTLVNRSLYGGFINKMADGSLPESVFQRYLQQDNLYLTRYARAFAALAARADWTDEVEWLATRAAMYIHEHGNTSVPEFAEGAFEREAMPITVAYTSFLMQAAYQDPVLAYAAIIPCQRLYDWLFTTLRDTRHIPDSNPYKSVIEQYADPSNHALTLELEAFLDRHAARGLPLQLEARAKFNYATAMKYEADFFEQSFGSARAAGVFAAVPAEAAAASEIAAARLVAVSGRKSRRRRLPFGGSVGSGSSASKPSVPAAGLSLTGLPGGIAAVESSDILFL